MAEVLESHRYRRIYFEGKQNVITNAGCRGGDLTIHGSSAQIRGQIVSEKEKLKVVISLDKSDLTSNLFCFFRAFKNQAIVKIVLEMPANALS